MDCENYADIIIKDTDSLFITRRIPLTMHGASGFSIDPSAATIAYHVECKAHRVKVEIDQLQVECVEDSIAFCPRCLAGSPPKKADPVAEALRRQLTGASCSRPNDKKRWHVGRPFSSFINDLDL